MLAAGIIGTAILCSGSPPTVPVALASQPCSSDSDRIVAYAKDRYAVRSQPYAAEPYRSRFVIRRLGTDEPIDQIDCASSGACELTTVLGMRGCSYANVSPG